MTRVRGGLSVQQTTSRRPRIVNAGGLRWRGRRRRNSRRMTWEQVRSFFED